MFQRSHERGFWQCDGIDFTLCALFCAVKGTKHMGFKQLFCGLIQLFIVFSLFGAIFYQKFSDIIALFRLKLQWRHRRGKTGGKVSAGDNCLYPVHTA